jgi:hypothetical protein
MQKVSPSTSLTARISIIIESLCHLVGGPISRKALLSHLFKFFGSTLALPILPSREIYDAMAQAEM